MTSHKPWSEDLKKGIQDVPIVESPAHFDLSEADVAAAREQGLEITSIRAFNAHAEDRLYETQPVIPDDQAMALMERLVTAGRHLPTPDKPRYQLTYDPSGSITLTTSEGRLLYRYSGNILLHNGLSPEDDAYLSAQLATVQTVTVADGKHLMHQVVANLDKWPQDPSVVLELDYVAGQHILLKRTDGTTVFHQVEQTVLCSDFQPAEWQSLTHRLAHINDPAPDPDPDLEL
ncbi:hypothetical protein Lepto7375DRAFT_0786 [Leptolyngbya sp. PCC 7375]|nr:hypothetical protein Lepto7375DRAFT_0786 [Leptolyngbya sp. PCC 7375]